MATVGDEVRGHAVVVKILVTAFACYGLPRNVEEYRNPDGRYIVTFDGAIDGKLIQIALLVTEDATKKVESLRLFARPWPVVKLFESIWSATWVLIRSPTPSGLCRHLHRESEGSVLGRNFFDLPFSRLAPRGFCRQSGCDG